MVDQQTEGGLTLDVMAEAKRHAVELEQCSIFVDSKPLSRSMTDAAAFLRRVSSDADLLARLARPADRPGDAAVPCSFVQHRAPDGSWQCQSTETGRVVETKRSGPFVGIPFYRLEDAPTPPAPVGLVDAVRAYRDAVESFRSAVDEWKPSQSYHPVRYAEAVMLKARAALDATLSGQTGGAVPAGEPRIAGLDLAADIADHWHQRFLTLGQEAENFTRQLELARQAKGAKQVLDEIKAERARLAEQPGGAVPAGDLPSVEAFAEALYETDYAEGDEARGEWAIMVSCAAEGPFVQPSKKIVDRYRTQAAAIIARLASQPGESGEGRATPNGSNQPGDATDMVRDAATEG